MPEAPYTTKDIIEKLDIPSSQPWTHAEVEDVAS